jgi:acyl phosphate:glycerol-3-phosphate acyltransferase
MLIEQIVLTFWIAYLVGAIPIAYLVSRLHGVDIFTIGSGNMGATNVARAVGTGWGLLTWALDMVKGVGAIVIARQLISDHTSAVTMIAAIGVIMGHNWSIIVMMITGHLRGGKGAAAALGTWLIFIPPLLIVIAFGIWLAIIITTRFMSLAVLTMTSVISLMIIGLVMVGYYEPVYVNYLIASGLIFFRHRDNIQRLLRGSERRFGESATQ